MGGKLGFMKGSTVGSSAWSLQKWPKDTAAVRCPLTLFFGGGIFLWGADVYGMYAFSSVSIWTLAL